MGRTNNSAVDKHSDGGLRVYGGSSAVAAPTEESPSIFNSKSSASSTERGTAIFDAQRLFI